jgi:Transposase DDE domain
MSEQSKPREKSQSAVQERLGWQAAQRDDRQVAQALHEGEEIEAMHELSEAGLLDEFFHYLELVGVYQLIEQLELRTVQRVFLPVTQLVLLYFLKIIIGIESMNALPSLLFSNVGLMRLVGFNASQVANGLTHRGDDRRRTKRKQGPLTDQCLAQNICKVEPDQLENFFNAVVRALVAFGVLRGEVTVALDGSKLPTTKKYTGRGCLKVEREVKEKGTKRLVKVVEYVYGWKVLVLIEVQTRLPLAIKVVPIQAYEGQYLLPLVEQAQANLGTNAHISKVVVDRGYLDGEDLWQLDQQGIMFVIVAKASMAVVEDAHALAKSAPVSERERLIRHGRGHTESFETLRTRLVGLEGLTTYDAYGSAEHTRQSQRKNFVGNPLNAVVVQTWDNRTPESGGTVYLTNGPVTDPFVVFDDYDWRSVIENGIFKEGKYPWHLGHFPQKTEAAVMVHCSFTLAVMGLCTAFRLWKAQGAPEPDEAFPPQTKGKQATSSASLSTALLQGEGMARWRRRLKEENRDKVIVFMGDAYGIFHLAEFVVLSGLRLAALPPELGSRQAILARYGLSP